MDVRCERCLTEYDLEDDSVSEAGTSVQCTTCGHTFQVRRSAPRPPVSTAAGPLAIGGPAPVNWTVETVQGRVHHVPELSALHVWIVERKVTRQDRICRPGQAWRKLDEIAELKPFFDAIDEADRAREAAARAAVGPPLGLGLEAQARSARELGPHRTPAKEVAVAASAPRPETEIETVVVPPRGRSGRMLFSFAVAAVVAYIGITRLPPVRPDKVVPLAVPGAATGAAWAPLPSGELEMPVASAAAASAGAPSPEPAEVPSVPTPPREPVAARPPAAEPAATKPVAGKTAAAPPVPDAERSVAARLYWQQVSDAFRLLDNGALTRAKKLLESALEQRPNGPEALAGMGYVNLDRNRFSLAIDYFKRALAESAHPPALFGLGEAYRYSGERRRAVAAYRRFLAVAPRDRDAAAARKQIRALSGGRRSSDVAPASSILQEGAK